MPARFPPPPNDNYDAPWKSALALYFSDFMAFFFPDVHEAIDWSRAPEFLDTELQQLARDGALGKRLADQLVRVYTLDGQERWVLLHIEVQASRDHELAERIFVYQYRIYDHYRREVASLVVLADPERVWRPASFSYEVFGCGLLLTFRTAKLQDHADRIDALLADDNPFALLTAAHLLTQQTHRQPMLRLAAKWKLTRLLLERDWERQRIVNLFHVIDWIMRLPKELEDQFWQDTVEHQGRPTMENYIPRGARIEMQRELAQAKEKAMHDGRLEGMQLGRKEGIQQGMRQGMQQGMQQGIQQGMQQGMQQGQASLLTLQLTQRFGPLPGDVAVALASAGPAQLQEWAKAVIDARSLDEIFPRH
jgi:hypothetical protein